MTPAERRAFERQLQQEFPEVELHAWYRQYRGLKAGYPDAVLLYRLGDFYETFDDDAKLAAELLDVTLTYKDFGTERRGGDKRRCPMAGMPYHSIEGYVTRLVGAGYRVAIAEQISETASSRSDTRPRSVFAVGLEQGSAVKGMVERKVVRVLTPGTVIESGLLTAERNNYLAALIADGGRIGLAYADLTTGEFAAAEFSGPRAVIQAQGELARLHAAEVLVPESPALRLAGLDPANARLQQDLEFLTREERGLLLPGERIARRVERENNARWAHGYVTAWPDRRWDLKNARDALLHQLGVQTLAGFGLADLPLAIRAAGAIVQYARETQQGTVANLRSLRAYTPGDVMFLDPQTRRNLELLEGSAGGSQGTLIGVLDQTRTPMGARLLRRWLQQPLLDVERLRARQDAVTRFVDDAIQRATLRSQLRQVGDMERVVNRVIQGHTVATPRDVARLREGLRALPELVAALAGWLPPAGEAPPLPDEAAAPLAMADAGDDAWEEDEGSAASAALLSASAPAHARSLREQREARRRVRPRYDEDDLFGEEPDDAGWEAEAPAAELQPTPGQPPSAAAPARATAGDALDPCADILALLERALDDEPPALLGASNYLRAAEGEQPRRVIRPGFEPAIDETVAASREAHSKIMSLEPRERERTGIKSLRVDYNKVFGYYIEVPRAYAEQVPREYIRKQTLSTGERYFTEQLKAWEEVVEGAQQKLLDLERRAFARICAEIAAAGDRLLATARLLAEVDVYAALSEAAVRGRYIRPSLHDDTRLRITAGRHPVVEQTLDDVFIPNDALLDTQASQILLVTGPNMSGKSTVMRQVALIVLMAQIGSFVPADAAEIGLVDRIFTRIGAQDDIATGQSTFMVEMTETAALLAQSTRRSLIILDEVGRGTSTYDGMAIAQAVLEYIHDEPRLGCRTLFATHYHELTELEGKLARLANYHMAATEQEGRVVFLHELRPGRADRSYGIHVAELAGIPREVIRRAGELLAELEHRDREVGAREQVAARAPAERGRRGHDSTFPGSTFPEPHAARPQAQLSLFDVAPHPVVELLRRLNINELTPLEALNRLHELQQAARGGDP